MLAPVPTHVTSDSVVPGSADVVVVGGGVVGAFTALELVERGVKVALCEKGEIAHEQSGRNLGWVRMTGRPAAEISLMARALVKWDELDQRLDAATGYVRCGIAYADAKPADAAARKTWLALPGAAPFLPTDVSDLRQIFAGSSFPSGGGIMSKFDGRAEPQLVASAAVEAARKRGATVLTNCAVRGFETSGGRVSKVFTSRGEIATSAVVVAGGLWSTLLLRRYGISLPQLEVLATVMSTNAIDGPEISFGTGDFAFRRRLDGGYNVGSFKTRVRIGPDTIRYGLKYLKAAGTQKIQYVVSRSFVQDLLRGSSWDMTKPSPFETSEQAEIVPWFDQHNVLRDVARYFPHLGKARLSHAWSGRLDVTPDASPVIDRVEEYQGLYVATGFSGHGFGLSPGVGELVAQLVAGEEPAVSADPFAISRLGRPARHRRSA